MKSLTKQLKNTNNWWKKKFFSSKIRTCPLSSLSKMTDSSLNTTIPKAHNLAWAESCSTHAKVESFVQTQLTRDYSSSTKKLFQRYAVFCSLVLKERPLKRQMNWRELMETLMLSILTAKSIIEIISVLFYYNL